MKLQIPSQTRLYFLLVFVFLAGFSFPFFLSAPVGFYAFIAASALAGFGVSLNIYWTKQHGQELVCPTGSDCNAVVNSRYAEFFGIPLEYWGMAYYALILASYLALIFVPQIFSSGMLLAVIVFSALAGLFSLYLLFVQGVLLRKWCIWCILSALLSLGIAIFSLVSADVLIYFLAHFSPALEIISGFGLALGIGGVTAVALIFSHALNDKEVTEKELSIIQSVFELVWIGLGFVLVGKFGLLIAFSDTLLSSGVFIAQMTSLAVAVIAAATLMIVYAPFLTYVPFDNSKEDSFATLRRPILIMGTIAGVAWYFAFFVNFLTSIAALPLLVGLLLLVTLSVAVVSLWERAKFE